MDIVRKRLPGIDDQLIELIKRVVSNGKKRGIRQGSPLSPLLLNYLDHLLDGAWRKLAPDERLLRTADDLCVPCRTEERAHLALNRLRQVLSPTGMQPNDQKSSVRTLHHAGDGADWLGYNISWNKAGTVVQIVESSWMALERKLEEVHTKPGSPLRAVQILNGWLDQFGPCYPYEDAGKVYFRTVSIAESLAFDELPDVDYFYRCWDSRPQPRTRIPAPARQSPEEIGRRLSVPYEAVEAYGRAFFDVVDRRDSKTYIVKQVIGTDWTRDPWHQSNEGLLASVAYRGGPIVLESALPYLLDGGHELDRRTGGGGLRVMWTGGHGN